jgi:diguanylate cyclase (GGDEF)-like protein/PAS domain S-box-containing protein
MEKKKKAPVTENSFQQPLSSSSSRNEGISDEALVLIVCSENRFGTSLQELLLVTGYKSFVALTEFETINILQENNFGLILLDLGMVESYGQNLMDQIKSRHGSGKLIMLSHDSIFDKAVWGLRQGADDFFKTPYSPDELLQSIKKQLNHTLSDKKSGRSHAQLMNSELLHRYMVNNSPDIVYLLDKNGNFSFFNKQVEKLLGFSGKELLGRHYSTLVHPGDLERSRFVFSERRTGQRASKNVELRLLHKDNKNSQLAPKQSDIDVELHSTGVYKNCKNRKEKIFLGTYGVVRDISQRKATEKQFHHQLYHDILTNLPNRSLFQDRLRLALTYGRRNKQCLAVMFLDIDGFKEINDSFGHACGDNLLQTFSVRLKSCLRGSDTLARISGDEFTVLIPQIEDRDDTSKVAQKIIDEFKIPFKMDTVELTIGVSIGIAIFPVNGESDEELLQKADWAMYYVKHHGKNGFIHFEDKMHDSDSRVFMNDGEAFNFISKN